MSYEKQVQASFTGPDAEGWLTCRACGVRWQGPYRWLEEHHKGHVGPAAAPRQDAKADSGARWR